MPDVDEDELARITTRSAEAEAEAEAAVPQRSRRPKVSDELRKKWAAQIERAQLGRTRDEKP
jgi:hypothetical protein